MNKKSRLSYRKKDFAPFGIEAKIAKIDRSDFKRDFDEWPALARRAWESPAPSTQPKPKALVIAGMGGSGIVGELISDFCREACSTTRISIIKDYQLPSDVEEASIILGVSSSGNTEETIAVLHEAARRGLKGYTFGTGGNIESFSEKNPGFCFTRTTMLTTPRSSLPALLYPVLKFLLQSKIVSLNNADVQESFKVLEEVRCNASDLNNLDKNKSYLIAKSLVTEQTFPLVYSTRRTRAVGLRFRQSLNENAKMHSFDGTIPELCHNEIVGWDARTASVAKSAKKENTPVPVLLALADDPEELITRLGIVREIITNNRGEGLMAPFSGKSFFARIMSMLYWLDYSTYYAAILRGIDPIGTPSIDFLKLELLTRLDYLKRFR
ncbi:MAG: SIS domain-containing protein [Nitrososphaerales archaeon]